MGRALVRLGLAAAAPAAVAATVLLTSGGSSSRAQPPMVRVMPLGDSITWGQGSAAGSSYRRPLWDLAAGQSRYPIRFVGSQRSGDLPEPANEGHRGYTIDGIRAGLDGWLTAARPDIFLLHIGVNDLSRGIDVAHAPDRFAAPVDRIEADRPGTGVIVMGLVATTPGLEPQTAAHNDRLRALVRAGRRTGRRLRYVAAPALTPAERVDRLHPADADYRRIADAFFPALSREAAERTSARSATGKRPTISGGSAR